MDVVRTINSYTEISQSGHGLHIFFRVSPDLKYDDRIYYKENSEFVKRTNKDDSAHLEIYLPAMTNRYVAMTGNTFHTTTEGDGLPLRSMDQLQVILNKYMRKPEQPKQEHKAPITAISANDYLSDSEVIERIQANAKQSALWAGDFSGYASNSEAELELAIFLAWYVFDDIGRIENLMEQSGFRENWLSKSEKYRTRTIEKAIQYNGGKHYDRSAIYDKQAAEKQKKLTKVGRK